MSRVMITDATHVSKFSVPAPITQTWSLTQCNKQRLRPILELSAPAFCRLRFSWPKLHMADTEMGAFGEAGEQILAAFQHLTPMLDSSLKLTQNAHPKRQRKGNQPPGNQEQPDHVMETKGKINLASAMTLMAKLAIQLDREMQLLKKEDTYIFFFANKENEGSLPLLVKATETWVQEAQALKEKPQTQQLPPLRQRLALVLFQTLQTRINQLGEAPDNSDIKKAAIHNKVLLPDQTCPYLEWSHEQKALQVSQKKPLTLKRVLFLCNDMLEALQDPNIVVRFHALPSTPSSVACPWKMQVSLRADQPWQALQEMSHLAIWLLVGCNLKQHSLHQSSLAFNLQRTLQLPSHTQGKGKGKSKGKSQKGIKAKS